MRGLRAPLADALAAELAQLDRQIVRTWSAMAGAGVVGGLLAAAAIAPSLGLACAATSAPFLLAFGAAWVRAGRPSPPRWLPNAVAALEGCVPWSFAVVLTIVQGPVYAMASWIPPMLFAALIVAQVARFRVVGPLVVGATSAVAHLVVYFVFVRPRLPLGPPLFAALPLQISRAVSLLGAGALGAAVAAASRRVVGRAEREVRAQDLFGKYRLQRHLASGGMGVVFEALYCPEGGFQRRVAVKRIHPHLASTEAFVAAFRAEAELSSRLAHPNVVQVLDFGRVGETYFLAMELVDGVSLAAVAKARRGAPLPEGLVVHLGQRLLAGLGHAHGGARDEAGQPLRVVHRDLCPANVLVSSHGDVKISDFGLARALGAAAQDQTRSLEGHAPYMAPEQVRCAPFDERVDLFAVGVVLWELLVGRPLFRQPTEHQTLLAVTEGVVPPPTLSVPVDAGWDAFFARALARDPQDRFRTAEEMAAALGALPATPAGAEALAALVHETLEARAARGTSASSLGATESATTKVTGAGGP